MYWGRVSRGFKRVALLLPLGLTALVFLMLPRQPQPVPASAKFVLVTSQAANDLEDYDHDKQLVQVLSTKTSKDSITNEKEDIRKRPWFMKGGELRPSFENQHGPLFPNDDPMDDRIISQLMYTLPDEDNIPIKKILLANGFGAWHVAGGRTEFKKDKCPVDQCELSADARDAATADAILFKDHQITFKMPRPSYQIWIMYYLECPYHTPSLRSVAQFNWTATYRRDSDIVAPYEKWVYHDPLVTSKKLDRNYAENKTKKVAWFVSNCHARNQRLQYARKLSKFISVDIYGGCGNLRCPRTDPDCLQMLNKDYKFYLAFENSNCEDYVTEKFFVNGLGHDIVPIVMGARPSEYAAMSPHNSYIHVEEFTGPEELAAYLHRLDNDDELYNSYFKWKNTGEFINTHFFCRVCAMLHASERRQRQSYYNDVQAWWREGTCKRGLWREEDGSEIKTEESIKDYR